VEIFWPLVTGARLVLAEPGRHGDASYVARTIESCGVTVAQFIPSLLREFLNAEEAARCDSLSLVVSSGGALSEDVRRRFREVSSAELLNCYGPTETSDIVTVWPCGNEESHGIVPIGRPIANASVYVLDARRQPVPPGVTGVLYVGGVGVARGYLNQPSLTEEKFLPNPFVADRSSRIYDTGDLVRYRHDGVIEFIGRADGQIKVNGCRLEPEEVETALRRHPDVSEAVVALQRDGNRLAAYVVPAKDARPAARDLRLFLRAIVPSYMVPTSIVILEALPRSTNGKIDHRRLPAPSLEGETAHVPAETELERTLCSLWSTVLETSHLGIDDDFFDLGGDSLGAVRLAALVSSTLGRDLPVKEILCTRRCVRSHRCWSARRMTRIWARTLPQRRTHRSYEPRRYVRRMRRLARSMRRQSPICRAACRERSAGRRPRSRANGCRMRRTWPSCTSPSSAGSA
jgi:nonribosomal peptide synthetase DhbF